MSSSGIYRRRKSEILYSVIEMKTLNRYVTHVSIACTILCCTTPWIYGQSKRVEGKITYIAGDAYYTDIGKDKGAIRGDTLYSKSYRNAILIIQSISRKSSYCTPIQTSQKISFGEEVFVNTTVTPAQPVPDSLTQKDTSRNVKSDYSTLWVGALSKAGDGNDSLAQAASKQRIVSASNQRPNQLSGRIAFQSFMSHDRLNPNYSYQQPGGLINIDINRIQGSYYNLSANIRFRKTYSSRPIRSDNYPVRIYELSLEYNNPSSPFRYAAGRIFAPVINGVGNFDGVFFGYKLSNHWEVGTFGGTQPNNLNSKPDMTNSKLGIYANYKKTWSPTWRWNTTMAFSGQYYNNKIDREYFYVQNDAALGSKVYFYQNSEIGINRSNLSNRKSKIEISNFYIMGHYTPVSSIALSASYDARINVFLIQSYRAIPDSLFDDALLQGFRGDVSWRATRQITISAGTNVRTRAGESRKTYLNSAGIYYYNFLRSQYNLNYRFFLTTTPYTKANSSSYGISKQFSNLYLTATFRTYHYRYTYQNSQYSRNSITLDGSYSISRRLFTTFEYEYSTGKLEKADRFFIELSFRL